MRCGVIIPAHIDDQLTISAQVDSASGVSTLKLAGSLLSTNVQTLKDHLHKVSTDGLVVDLADIDHVDSLGIGALVNAQITRKKAGKTLVLAAVGDRVMTVLKGTQVDQLFRFAPSASEAQAMAANA